MKALSGVKFVELDSPLDFHMPSYLLDVVCVTNDFIGMGWSWSLIELSVQIYCQILWRHNYMRYFTQICDCFFSQYANSFYGNQHGDQLMRLWQY